MSKYDDFDWAELPSKAKKAAEVLGYNKRLWDKDIEPATCDKYWKDLTGAEKDAAIVLGYDESSWDDESDSSDDED